MKIFFHIGTEKTGSSHLQSIAAINRERLRVEGIWFPKAGKRESQLLEGEISAGNVQDITDALNAENYLTCEEIIGKHIAKAKEYHCHSLFLSNELLMLALAKKNRLEKLETIIDGSGSHEVKYLLFLRDPVSQALSLYKHRAKSGGLQDIESWPQKHYYYGAEILSFLNEAKQNEIALTCRKFSRKSGALEGILFQEWLGVDTELTLPPKLVNPSLSLSELLLLSKVRHHQPQLANLLYKRLIKINKEHKSENKGIDQYHRNLLSNYLVRFEETWNLCNFYLPEFEKIAYPIENQKINLQQEKVSSFTEVQMDEISGIITDSLSLRTKFRVEWLKVRRRLGLLRNYLFNK